MLAKVWEEFLPDEDEEGLIDENLKSGRDTIARAFSSLLQKAWLIPSNSAVSFLTKDVTVCYYNLSPSVW